MSPAAIRLVQVGACALALASASSGVTLANGRPPQTVDTAFQPGDDSRILLPSSFGLLISEDDGGSFRWICEETVGYGGTYDPDYAISSEGTIYATTFTGLRVSRDKGCTFESTEFYDDPTGGESPELVANPWVNDVEIDSDGKVWAVTATGTGNNNVFVSTDGQTFNGGTLFDPVAWWRTVRVAPSNTDIVYVSGFQLPTMDADGTIVAPSRALLRTSVDGGATWTDRSDTLEQQVVFGMQPSFLLLGVSPTDASTVYAHDGAVEDPPRDAVYRSTDGGANWEKILDLADTVTAFTIRSNGALIVGTNTPCADDPAGAQKGCVFLSPSGDAASFVKPNSEPRMGCVGERSDGALFACGWNGEPDNFALGRSSDDGQTWDEVLRISDIVGPLECPQGTAQHTCATQSWPLMCLEMEICTSPDAGPGDDGDNGGDGGGCGCQASSRTTPVLLGLIMLLMAVWRRRSARRR